MDESRSRPPAAFAEHETLLEQKRKPLTAEPRPTRVSFFPGADNH
jgi:hypothetical protein